jgi:hypothetical protein
MKKLLPFIFLSAFVPVFGWAKIKEVKIYHVPWDVLTFVAMLAEDVRKTAPFKIQISDATYAERFARSLAQEKMSEGDRLPVSDIRLVIDITDEDGSVVSFCASRFELGAQKSGKKRTIDDAFRARFTALYEEKG